MARGYVVYGVTRRLAHCKTCFRTRIRLRHYGARNFVPVDAAMFYSSRLTT